MKIIEFSDPHRRKHFEYFRGLNHPHFAVCANVDITAALAVVKERRLKFMPAMVWVASKAANSLPEFRQRIRGEQVVEHDAVHPSFTVPTEASEVFSFCEVKFSDDFGEFQRRALEQIAQVSADPSFEDEPGRDDYLFLSSAPWVTFTSVQHAMHFHPCDSVPRIVWGKWFEENGRVKMPLSVQVHHTLVDGRHAGLFYEKFEALCGAVEQWAQAPA